MDEKNSPEPYTFFRYYIFKDEKFEITIYILIFNLLD